MSKTLLNKYVWLVETILSLLANEIAQPKSEFIVR